METHTSTNSNGSTTTFSVSSRIPILDDGRVKPMTDRELRQRLEDIETAARRAKVERPGLYILLILILLKGCSLESNIDGVNSKVTAINGASETKIVVTK